MLSENILMDMMNQTNNRFFCIKRAKKRNTVFGIDNYIKLISEFENIVKNRPDIDRIATAPADNIYTVNNLIPRGFSVVSAEKSNIITSFGYSFGDFVYIYFRSTCPNMPCIPPVEN